MKTIKEKLVDILIEEKISDIECLLKRIGYNKKKDS